MKSTNIDVMENMPVPKAIIKLAIPALITTIISLVYNLTDTFFIGMLDDPIQLGAISLAFPVFMLVQAVGNIFGHGVPSAASTILMSFASILMQNLASGYGDYVISAYGVATKMITIAFMLVMGYASILFARAFMGAFTTEQEIIEIGVQFLRAYAFCLPVLGIQISLMCTFQATGSAVRTLIVSLGRQCLFNMPLIVILNYLWQFEGLVFAGPMADILTAAAAALLAIPLLHRLKGSYKKDTVAIEL